MNPRFSLGKAAVVACSLVLSSAYIYYRSGGGWFDWSSGGGVPPNGVALDALGNETAQAQLERILMFGGTKSTAMFTPRDTRSGQRAAAQRRGSDGR